MVGFSFFFKLAQLFCIWHLLLVSGARSPVKYLKTSWIGSLATGPGPLFCDHFYKGRKKNRPRLVLTEDDVGNSGEFEIKM